MYLDALTELAKYFRTMEHAHYARWVPVQLRDMAELPRTHPNVAKIFRKEKKHAFSYMARIQVFRKSTYDIK